MSKRESIIARGPFYPSSAEYKRRFHALHSQLTAKYAAEIARASFLKRIAIWFRIQWEISLKLDSPSRSPYSLYQTRSKG